MAQSGRKVTRPVAVPAPTATPEPSTLPASNETAPDPDGDSPTRPQEAPPMRSLLVAGEVVHPYAYYNSNEMDIALRECVRSLKAHRGVTDAVRLGKLKYEDAKKEAKLQTSAYVIWISFLAVDDGYGQMMIKYADYLVLEPKTGTRVTFGRIRPDVYSPVATGGVLGIPTVRPQSSPVLARNQMKSIARQLPEILAHGGWLERK